MRKGLAGQTAWDRVRNGFSFVLFLLLVAAVFYAIYDLGRGGLSMIRRFRTHGVDSGDVVAFAVMGLVVLLWGGYRLRHWFRGRAGLDQWPDPYGRYYDEWRRLPEGAGGDYYVWLAARMDYRDPWWTWVERDRAEGRRRAKTAARRERAKELRTIEVRARKVLGQAYEEAIQAGGTVDAQAVADALEPLLLRFAHRRDDGQLVVFLPEPAAVVQRIQGTLRAFGTKADPSAISWYQHRLGSVVHQEYQRSKSEAEYAALSKRLAADYGLRAVMGKESPESAASPAGGPLILLPPGAEPRPRR